MTDIARLHRELIARVLGSAGTAPPEHAPSRAR